MLFSSTSHWCINDIKEIVEGRRAMKNNLNIAISGLTGSSKSTLAFRIFSRFDKFKPWDNIHYDRASVIEAVSTLIDGYIMDDEAIQSAYKRQFQNVEQQDLIKYFNMYRDSRNFYCACIPEFYALDKDFRKIFKMHIHVISRGIGVVHLPKDGRLYSDDPWDIAYNQKVEQNWAKYAKYHPDFKPPYHKLSTFAGYIYFNDMTDIQRALYEEIKKTKRNALYGHLIDDKKNAENNKFDILYDKYKKGEVDKQWLDNYCELEGMKVANVLTNLRTRARDEGTTLGNIDKEKLIKEKVEKIRNGNVRISELV